MKDIYIKKVAYPGKAGRRRCTVGLLLYTVSSDVEVGSVEGGGRVGGGGPAQCTGGAGAAKYSLLVQAAH